LFLLFQPVLLVFLLLTPRPLLMPRPLLLLLLLE
jgi:hypothetical protein